MNPLRPLLRAFTGAKRRLAVVPRMVEAILVLPRLAEQLDRVARNTDALSTVSSELMRVAANTDHLTAVAHHTGRLVDNTALLPETNSEIIVMRAAIIEMQGNTSTMATDLSGLVGIEQAIPPLLPLLQDVDGSVRRLAEIVEPLHGAATRVGRFADRLPSRGASLNSG